MKSYHLERSHDGQASCWVHHGEPGGEGDRVQLDPAASQQVHMHTDAGWEWGYAGARPAQLALAILLDVTHDSEVADKLHHDFMRDWLVGLKREGGLLQETTLVVWLGDKLRRLGMDQEARRWEDNVMEGEG